MTLQPNIGSDRSWVWKVAADFAEGEPTSETLAIRLANVESMCPFFVSFCLVTTSNLFINLLTDANQFKAKFDEAKENNAKLAAGSDSTKDTSETPAATEDKESAEKKDD